MCEVFLLRDLAHYELSVRGIVEGLVDLNTVGAVLERLPQGCGLVVDLTDAKPDSNTMIALSRLLRLRQTQDVEVAIATDQVQLRAWLVTGGFDASYYIADTVEGAARLLARRLPLALSA